MQKRSRDPMPPADVQKGKAVSSVPVRAGLPRRGSTTSRGRPRAAARVVSREGREGKAYAGGVEAARLYQKSSPLKHTSYSVETLASMRSNLGLRGRGLYP